MLSNSLGIILGALPEWTQKIWNFILAIGDFFVLVWNDEDRWWCIGVLIFIFGAFLLFLCPTLIFSTLMTIIGFFGKFFSLGTHSENPPFANKNRAERKSPHLTFTVTIKGVYQMNGPKPFTRIIECPSSETGYYSQLAGNKTKQAQWIQANFPGANVRKGFSMTVNIK